MPKKYDGFKNQETLDFWSLIQQEPYLTELKELVKPFLKKRSDRGFSEALKKRFPNESKKVSFTAVALRCYSKMMWIKEKEELLRILKEEGKYSGWSNRETWAMSLHFGNDYGLYIQVQDLKNSSKTWQDFSDKLKDFANELKAESLESPTKELVSLFFDIGSFWRIDFDEIAKASWEE